MSGCIHRNMNADSSCLLLVRISWPDGQNTKSSIVLAAPLKDFYTCLPFSCGKGSALYSCHRPSVVHLKVQEMNIVQLENSQTRGDLSSLLVSSGFSVRFEAEEALGASFTTEIFLLRWPDFSLMTSLNSEYFFRGSLLHSFFAALRNTWRTMQANRA